jgi:hypothetical protein
MLWYKGWLETQFKLFLTFAVMSGFMIAFHVMGAKAPPSGGKVAAFSYLVFNVPCFVIVTCTWLAGAGIATQPSVQAAKGLHGSTLFTVSLPVSRFRLLAVRAGLGWLEMVGMIAAQCCGMWFAIPFLIGAATPNEMFEFAVTLTACASAVYFLSVLLATFLDDQWRMWGTLFGSALLWWLPSHTPLPASADIFRVMGEGSPLLAHAVPWTGISVALALSAILFFAALRIVQNREY